MKLNKEQITAFLKKHSMDIIFIAALIVLTAALIRAHMPSKTVHTEKASSKAQSTATVKTAASTTTKTTSESTANKSRAAAVNKTANKATTSVKKTVKYNDQGVKIEEVEETVIENEDTTVKAEKTSSDISVRAESSEAAAASVSEDTIAASTETKSEVKDIKEYDNKNLSLTVNNSGNPMINYSIIDIGKTSGTLSIEGSIKDKKIEGAGVGIERDIKKNIVGGVYGLYNFDDKDVKVKAGIGIKF